MKFGAVRTDFHRIVCISVYYSGTLIFSKNIECAQSKVTLIVYWLLHAPRAHLWLHLAMSWL